MFVTLSCSGFEVYAIVTVFYNENMLVKIYTDYQLKLTIWLGLKYNLQYRNFFIEMNEDISKSRILIIPVYWKQFWKLKEGKAASFDCIIAYNTVIMDFYCYRQSVCWQTNSSISASGGTALDNY